MPNFDNQSENSKREKKEKSSSLSLSLSSVVYCLFFQKRKIIISHFSNWRKEKKDNQLVKGDEWINWSQHRQTCMTQ
jgi:hypothetical protein